MRALILQAIETAVENVASIGISTVVTDAGHGTHPFNPSPLFRVVDVAGVVANGFLGGALARRLRFDIVGFLVLGLASGLAGGAFRDMLLGQGPAVMLTDPAYLTGALTAATIAYLVEIRGRFTGRVLTLADMLAVGCWSATGAAKALGVGLGWLPALFLGTTTAVGGGLVRDVLVGRTPVIFGGNPLYASVAIIGSAEMTVLSLLGHSQLGMATSIVSCAALGLLARSRGWVLPGAPGAADWASYRGRLPRGWRRPRSRGSGTDPDAPPNAQPAAPPEASGEAPSGGSEKDSESKESEGTEKGNDNDKGKG